MFGSNTEPDVLAFEYGYIDELPTNKNFIFYDIECSLKKENSIFGKSVKIFSHKLLSIAVNSYMNNKHTQKVWVVQNDSVEAEESIVDSFLNFCFEESEKMIIDNSITLALARIKNELENTNVLDISKGNLMSVNCFLKRFTKLNILGFNSSKYDLNVIFHRLIKSYYITTSDLSEINIIKKGSNYFSIMLNNLWFKDLLNFTSPQSLDTYLRV